MFSDHPLTIKKRFISVLFMLIFSPLYTWYFIRDKIQVRFRQNINFFCVLNLKIKIFRFQFCIGWASNGMEYLYLLGPHWP